MKLEDNQIYKKLYVKPDIKRIAIDRNISIAMTTPDQPPIEPPPEEPPPEWPPIGFSSGNKPDYGKHTYKPENPFGGSRPEY